MSRRPHPNQRFTDEEVLYHAQRVLDGELSWNALARDLDCSRYTIRGRYLRITDPTLRERDVERARRGTQKRREQIRELIYAARDCPCVDCGVRLPPACMELDHVRGEKLFALSVGRVGSGKDKYRSLDAIKAEIKKCDARCPNCHRLRHYHERISEGLDGGSHLSLVDPDPEPAAA